MKSSITDNTPPPVEKLYELKIEGITEKELQAIKTLCGINSSVAVFVKKQRPDLLDFAGSEYVSNFLVSIFWTIDRM